MNQTNTHRNPLATNRLLKYLGLAVDELKLLRSINRIIVQVALVDAAQYESRHRRYLMEELRNLNERLESVRERARPG